MTEDRYARQRRLPEVGEAGQARLARATVAVVGCGATGSHIADALARAGVGTIRIADRDIVTRSNLQRQILFEDADAAAGRPKAAAAAARLRAVNPEIRIEARAIEIGPGNVRGFIRGASLVLDGTDNFPTRLLVNDACLEAGIPWVYAGVIGTGGHVLPVLPGKPPCFRCYIPEPPPPGAVATCDVAGVLGPAVAAVAARAAATGLRLLIEGAGSATPGRLEILDVWRGDARSVAVPAEPGCPACRGRYEFLAGAGTAAAVPAVLCGREAVELPPHGVLDLDALARALAREGSVSHDAFSLRLTFDGLSITIFEDGRAIVDGTTDTARAQALYDRLVGR